jgi:hypothetical protein
LVTNTQRCADGAVELCLFLGPDQHPFVLAAVTPFPPALHERGRYDEERKEEDDLV